MAREGVLRPGKRDGDVLAAAMVPSLPLFGGRRRLSDITNLQTRDMPAMKPLADKKNPPFMMSVETDCAQLLKENTALLRLLGEKNLAIEHGNMELQKLRTVINKLQVQNWQLAHANSQMTAELNMGKDKLKMLRHELGCTEAALKTKTLEQKSKKLMYKKYCARTGDEELNMQNVLEQDEPHLVGGTKFSKSKQISNKQLKTLQRELGYTEASLKPKNLGLKMKNKTYKRLSVSTDDEELDKENVMEQEQHLAGGTKYSKRKRASDVDHNVMKNKTDNRLSVSTDDEELDKENVMEQEQHLAGGTKYSKRKRASDVDHNVVSEDTPNVSSTTTICQEAEEEKGDNRQRSRRLRSSISKSQLSKEGIQSLSHPEVLHGGDQAVQADSPLSSSSSDIPNLEKVEDQNAEKAPHIPNSNSERNGTKRPAGRCPSNRNLHMGKTTSKVVMHSEETPVKGLVDNKDVQIIQLDSKPNSPCPTSIAIKTIEDQEQGIKGQDVGNERCSLQSQNQEMRGSSAGRPSRRATIGKSYKERPVNIKMRRD